jgi:hypothetical protein
MRRTFVLALILATALAGQKLESEGKAWLNSNKEPADVNVNGKWHAGEWGLITLNQATGGRDVTGNASGDGLDILGVVSAAKVFLVFSRTGNVKYSIEVSPEGSNVLAGQYADGLSWKSGTRIMHLTRAGAQEHPSIEAQGAQAHVVFYRVRRLMGRFIKPAVYCDDQEAAFMYGGHYFTAALSPGKHSLASDDQYTSVSLDAEPGQTYYVRVALSKSEPMRATFKVEQVDNETAAKDLRRLKPAEASHITRRDMVSADLPPK